jgi:hypothetical protein
MMSPLLIVVPTFALASNSVNRARMALSSRWPASASGALSGRSVLKLAAICASAALLESSDATTWGSAALSPGTVAGSELPAFDSYPLPEDEVSLDMHTGIVEVISPVFREGNKWKFAQGTATFWAEVADKEFLDNVARHGIVFGQGDALRVQMEVRTTVGVVSSSSSGAL